MGKDGTGTLKVRNGGVVTAKSVSINSKSVLSIDVGNNSLLNVDSGHGAIVNNGTVRIMAGAGPAAYANYKPISAATWTGSGAVRSPGREVEHLVSPVYCFPYSKHRLRHSGQVRFEQPAARADHVWYKALDGRYELHVGGGLQGHHLHGDGHWRHSLTGLQKAAGGGESVLGGWQFRPPTTRPPIRNISPSTSARDVLPTSWNCGIAPTTFGSSSPPTT